MSIQDQEIQHGEFCWNELITPNLKEAKAFYGALFGWKMEETKTHDASNATYVLLKQGETAIGGLIQTPKGEENHLPPHWATYVNVDNLEKTLEQARSLGGKVTHNITSVGNFGRFAVIQDPMDSYISLWESVKS